MGTITDASVGKLLQYGEQIVDSLAGFAGNFFIAMLILFVGFKVAKWAANLVKKFLTDTAKVDDGVITFLYSFVNLGIKVLVIFTAVTKLGVESSSILALFGSATVAIGLALQGSLSNIAGGVLILILKPFQIGDYIIEDNSKNEGTVCDIDLFYTKLKTGDNKTVIVPNSIITSASLTNVTRQDYRRVDLLVGISYDQRIDVVKEVLFDIIKNHEMVVIDEEKDVKIYVDNFGASSVDIGIRFWAPMDDYWKVRWDVLEKIKVEFDNRGIEIPYNKLDVHVTNVEK